MEFNKLMNNRNILKMKFDRFNKLIENPSPDTEVERDELREYLVSTGETLYRIMNMMGE